MAKVIPFRAVRPSRDKVHLVASRAFYTYPKHVLEAKLDSNPFSFIHIINPEFREVEKTAPNSAERFNKVKASYQNFKSTGILQKDRQAAFYIYKQAGTRSFRGIIAGTAVEDYMTQVIKKHEDTLTKREEVFKDYLKICEFNAEPVLMTYPDHEVLKSLYDKYEETRADFEFTTTDKITHYLWPVFDETDQQSITQAFEEIDALYIADGHHRSASSSLLACELRDNGESNSLNQFFMSYLIPESDLQIMDFNRLVRDLNGMSTDEFLDKLSQHFSVEKSDTPVKPNAYNSFGLYLDKEWYALTLKTQIGDSNPVDQLDPAILSKLVLDPILNIADLKTSERVHFEGGPNGFNKMVELIDKGKYRAGFSLFPVSVEQLKTVADAGLTMPPKSTWIEPKLRSGLTIYEF